MTLKKIRSPMFRFIGYRDIWHRLHHKNMNWLGQMSGGTGIGKSGTCITIAKTLDPGFTSDRIVTNAEEFMELLKNGNLKPGDFIVWDEAGIGIAAKDFQTKINRAMDKVVQTFRYRNLGVLFNSPAEVDLDKAIRRKFHAYIEPFDRDMDRGLTINKFQRRHYNPKLDKTYYINYVGYDDNMPWLRVKHFPVAIPHPPKKIWREYLKMKQEFNYDLTDLVIEGFKPKEKKKKQNKHPHLNQLVKYVEEEAGVDDFLKYQPNLKRVIFDKSKLRSGYGLAHKKTPSINQTKDISSYILDKYKDKVKEIEGRNRR